MDFAEIEKITEKVKLENSFIQELKTELSGVIIGQEVLVERIIIAFMSGGHILLEGLPGLAKTLSVRAFARAVNTGFARVQFTPDLLPADLIGTRIYNPRELDFFTRKGPIFTNILLADEMKQAIMTFDPSGSYLGDYFTTDRYVPYRMYPVDSTSIVGSMLDLEMGDQIFFSFYIGRFDVDSLPSTTYSTLQWEWPAPQMYTDIECMDFAAGIDGRVFLTQDNTAYYISVFSGDGEELFSIENSEVDRIPKTSEEIEEEIEYFESWAREDQGYTGGYEPSPYHHLISIAGVDSQGNLWVERFGNDTVHQFDVWDDTGNLLYTASFTGYSGIDLMFSVDQYGILAAVIDPGHFPQILELELETDIEVDEE